MTAWKHEWLFGHFFRGGLYRFANTRIRATAADVPHLRFDVIVRWIIVGFQHRRRHHHLADLAVPALRNVVFSPCFLDRMVTIVRQAFDRRYFRSDHLPEFRHTRLNRISIDVNGADATLGYTASVFRSRQTEMVSKYPQQRSIFGDILQVVVLSVDVKSSHGLIPNGDDRLTAADMLLRFDEDVAQHSKSILRAHYMPFRPTFATTSFATSSSKIYRILRAYRCRWSNRPVKIQPAASDDDRRSR